MKNKKFKVGEYYYYYDEENETVLLGKVERKPHKPKMFSVVYPDGEVISTRLDDVADLLYKEENLPDEAKKIIYGSNNDLDEKDNVDEDFVDIVVELESDESGVDAIKRIEKEAVLQKKDVIGKIVYQDNSVQYVFSSKDSSLLYVTNCLDELKKWSKENKDSKKSKEIDSSGEDKYKMSISSTKEELNKTIESLNNYLSKVEEIQNSVEKAFCDLDEISDYFKGLKEYSKTLWPL